MRIIIFALVILLGACSSLPSSYLEQQQLTTPERTSFNQQVFDKAWTLVNENFYDINFDGNDWSELGNIYRTEALEARDTIALYEIINELLNELDVSHLGAFRVQEEQPEAGGFGFTIKLIDGLHIVDVVLADSPAGVAGVQKGWVLKEIEGISYSDGNITQGYVVQPDSRAIGEAFSFKFIDNEEQQRLLIINSVIGTNPYVRLVAEPEKPQELPGGFIYIRVPVFYANIVKALKEALTLHASAPGVILDLRDNPGGLVFYEKAAAGYFFSGVQETGLVVKRNGKSARSQTVLLGTIHYEGEVVILTNSRSGSGAESFSETMQFYNRATTVGRRTAGQMLIAKTYRLPDGGSILIPIRDYFGLNGQRIEGQGVLPNIKVPVPSLESMRAGRDVDLEVALQVLNGTYSE